MNACFIKKNKQKKNPSDSRIFSNDEVAIAVTWNHLKLNRIVL